MSRMRGPGKSLRVGGATRETASTMRCQSGPIAPGYPVSDAVRTPKRGEPQERQSIASCGRMSLLPAFVVLLVGCGAGTSVLPESSARNFSSSQRSLPIDSVREQPKQPFAIPVAELPVANHDPSSVHLQPDWDAQAQSLARDMAPRLRDARLPRTVKAACREMLAQAVELYTHVERTDARALTLEKLAQMQESDRKGCEAELSVKAVHCVTLRLEDRDAELAWLVDQCNRAFPKGENTR